MFECYVLKVSRFHPPSCILNFNLTLLIIKYLKVACTIRHYFIY
uniref:Uncharacterized protein n=1 Tax=Ciona intestinalis TaxID=7719 RepID=H2XZP6_CIOIN